MKTFSEYANGLNEAKEKFKKGTEYKISWDNEMAFGEFIGTGKGTEVPNKGKDVYIFKAVIDKEYFKDGEIKVGFVELEKNIKKVIEVA